MASDGLHLSWRALHLAKHGNAPEEYEDAFAGDPALGRFAIADGASETSFAAKWAELLARGFLTAPSGPWNDTGWLTPLRKQWATEVDGRPLPWYAESKREQGAYATLLGVLFRGPGENEDSPRWRALAVGDSCLFSTRGGRLQQSFPVKCAADFSNTPSLLGSRGRPADTPADGLLLAQGKCRAGDRFYLMTDALAEWTLRQTEEDRKPFDEMGRLLNEANPQASFAGWIEERRNKRGLRNDDVTLVIIDLENKGMRDEG
jgi:hypothetical protein